MSWIDEAIIYQINLRSLAVREPRNAIEAIGEMDVEDSPLVYVTANLEKIAELGINVLYLCPPYPIGVLGRKGIGSPYSSSDFMAVEPEYGTLDEIKVFIKRAHELDLRVIFDITPNHTSRDHVWTKSNPDYYVHDENGELFYDFDWSDVAKLDYDNPELCRAMIEVFDFWLSILGEDGGVQPHSVCSTGGRAGATSLRSPYRSSPQGIDGFRLDMAHMISDLGFWDDAMAELRQKYSTRPLLFLAECYGTQNNLDLFNRGINAAYDDDFYKICQYLYAVDDAGNSFVHESSEAEQNGDFADKLADYRCCGIAAAVLRSLLNYEEPLAICEGPWVARYTDNHDEGRGLHRFGAGAVRAMNQLLFLSPHCIPFILTGQEFGAINRPSIHERMGVCDKGPTVVYDNNVAVVPGVEFEGNLFERDMVARQDWYQFYKSLISLRLSNEALIRGEFIVVNVGEEIPRGKRSVVAFDRRLDGTVIRCAINMGEELRQLVHADLLEGNVLYGGLVNGCLEPFGAIVVEV